jgi:hypothetical protein
MSGLVALRSFADDLAAARLATSQLEPTSEPASALADSRVDLVRLLADGVPEPTWVPGCDGWLRAGARYLCPSPAGAGKSLSWLVVAVEVVKAGGRVEILDVENGSDEYARRLDGILAAGDPDGLTVAIRERLGYHAWPPVKLKWSAEEWTAAMVGVDLVIFDSSRMMLSAVGLNEDSADDYSKFMAALVMPLSQAGITTVILDNVGHEHQDRARGTTTKSDLNEVVLKLVVTPESRFDRDRAGHARLVLARHRFSGLPREVQIDLGGGVYGPPRVVQDSGESYSTEFRPTVLMERTSRLIEAHPGISNADLRTEVRGNQNSKAAALRVLVAEGFVEQRQDGKTSRHHSIRPFRDGNE